MGIPLYFKILTDNYPNIIKQNIDNDNQKNLFLDLNCAIHPCAHKVLENYNSESNNYESIEKKIINETINYINKLVDLVKPTMLYIAIDGVAPVAKMNQQRMRRYKSIYERNIIDNNKKKLNIENTKFKWDTNAISPGTNFMKKLSELLINYLKNNYKFMKIYFSDSSVPGEGEHKILDFIKENEFIGNTVIYGLDADLIILSMVSQKSDIFLLRESLQFGKVVENSFLYLDIDLLKYYLFLDLKEQILMYDSKYIFKEDEDIILINDYIFISFFVGNDFLPHLPSYSLRNDGLNMLLEKYIVIYVNYGNPLIDIYKKKINNNVLSAFIRKISECENELLIKYNNKRKKFRFRTFKTDEYERQLELLNNKPSIERKDEDYIDIGTKNWSSRYYEKCLNVYEEEDLESCVYNYLKMLKWNFEYYYLKCNNYTYKYNYRHAPCATDISRYLNNIDINEIKINKTRPYSSIIQLLTIMPKNSIHLIDSKFRCLMSEESNIADYYPEHFKLDSYYKRYFWQCEPILPNLNYDRVIKSIKDNKLQNYHKKHYNFGKVIIIN